MKTIDKIGIVIYYTLLIILITLIIKFIITADVNYSEPETYKGFIIYSEYCENYEKLLPPLTGAFFYTVKRWKRH